MKKIVAMLAAIVMLATMVLLPSCNQKNKYDVEFFVTKFEVREVWDELEKKFKEETGYTLQINSPQEASDLLVDRIRNNNTPDVFQSTLNATFGTWVKEGKIKDVTGMEFLNNIDADALPPYYIDGVDGVYTIPLSYSCEAWYYNATAFQEYGYDLPENWDDVTNLVDKINADRVAGTHNAQAFAIAGGDPYLIHGMHEMLWAQEAGGAQGAQDYLLYSDKGSIGASTAAGAEMGDDGYDSIFNAVADKMIYMAENAQANYGTAKAEDAITSFVNEEALIFPAGTFTLPLIRQAEPGFTVEMMPFVGDIPMIIGDADLSISVAAKPGNEEATAAFLEFFTRKDVYQIFYDADGNTPSVKDIDVGGKFPETAGIAEYFNTDNHVGWLHRKWSQEADFQQLTIDFMISKDKSDLKTYLNNFFDAEKDILAGS